MDGESSRETPWVLGVPLGRQTFESLRIGKLPMELYGPLSIAHGSITGAEPEGI